MESLPKKKKRTAPGMFFLNDSCSEYSSSESDENAIHRPSYLMEHEVTKQSLQEKAKELAMKAEAARI